MNKSSNYTESEMQELVRSEAAKAGLTGGVRGGRFAPVDPDCYGYQAREGTPREILAPTPEGRKAVWEARWEASVTRALAAGDEGDEEALEAWEAEAGDEERYRLRKWVTGLEFSAKGDQHPDGGVAAFDKAHLAQFAPVLPCWYTRA